MEKIIEALKSLDHENHEHWTADGYPRLPLIKNLTGDATVTREMVESASPGFRRGGVVGEVVDSPVVEVKEVIDQVKINDEKPATEDSKPVEKDTEKPSDEQILRERLKKQEGIVAEMREQKAKFDAAFEVARKCEDELREKLEAMATVSDSSDAIQSYLASQKKILEDRAARKQLIRESGLNLNDLAKSLKAPIDAVRARKTGR